jgi:DtxR family Mn-dependent transcriptional regulator
LTINLKTDSIVSTNEIANLLDTSAASVTEMLKKLQQKELVNYIKYKGVTLSKSGNKKATNIIRKHRLWETFLVETLDFNWSEVHDVAEELEHIKSPKLIDKLDHFLNYPKFDPHGDPIPTKHGIIKSSERIILSEVTNNRKAIILGVSLDDKEFLNYLTILKINIGTNIEIVEKNSFDQSMKIKINTKLEYISQDVTQNILVKIIK